MSNTPFQFPPPPPPPPRREAHTEPGFQQSSYQYTQPGRGRGRGPGPGVGRGAQATPHARGRANYANNNSRGGYGRGGNGNAGAYGGSYGFQQRDSYAEPYGQSNNYTSSRDQSYTSAWNQATRGGTMQSHGFHHNGPIGPHFPSLYRPPPRNMQPQNAYPSPPSSSGLQPPRKRPFSTAFAKPPTTGSRPHAAPAVPSFNAGIPLSLPAKTTDPLTAKTKKPRKHNQLGLTPASQDHESSSDDENEEVKLASNMLSNANMVQFEYKGRTAILRTAAEIAAWIAERKKNYPTEVRADAAKKEAAERKRKWAEVRKQRDEAAQAKGLERKKAQQEELRLKALESKNKDLENEKKKVEGARNDEIEEEENNAIKAKKARIKADKLRLRAEKAELKVLEAEAEARKAKKRRAGQQSSTPVQDESKGLEIDADSAIALEDNDTESAGEADGVESETICNMHQNIKDAAKKKAKTLSSINGEDDGSRLISHSSPRSSLSLLSISDSSALSDAESTSSSASSSSSSDAHSNSDSESAPEQATSKRLQPTRVPPPPRRPPLHTRHLCRSLLATGHCRRGDECQYSHDLPETLPSLGERKQKLKEKRKTRLGKVKAVEGPAKKERRKGLWQVMVEKEQEEQRKQVLRAIVFMGDKGMLGDGEKKGGGREGAT